MFFFLSIGLKSKTCLNEISIIGYNLDLNLVLSLLSWGTLFNQSSCVTVHIHVSDALFQSRPDCGTDQWTGLLLEAWPS